MLYDVRLKQRRWFILLAAILLSLLVAACGNAIPSKGESSAQMEETATVAAPPTDTPAPAPTDTPAESAPEPTPTPADEGAAGQEEHLTLNINPDHSGSVAIDGTGNFLRSYQVGDDANNVEWRTFLSFDLSGIRQPATVQKATLQVSCNLKSGDPASLGETRVALFPYSEFDPFYLSTSGFRGVEDIFGELNCPGSTFEVTSALQRSFAEGSTSFNLVIASVNGPNNNSSADMMEITGAQLDVVVGPGATGDEGGALPPEILALQISAS